MRICITRGIYGFRQDGGMVEKTNRSAPFEVEDEEGRRLILLGVAREVHCGGKENRIPDTPLAGEGGPDSQAEDTPPDGLENMSFSELRKAAKELGIKGSGSREELIERLRQCPEWKEDEDGEEALEAEDMPELTAEEPE